jgi:PAS domain S-box-containing protein
VRVHLVPDIAPDGEVNGVYSLVIDVDEDHRLREALTEQEARLRFFAENIPGPIAVVDRDLNYIFANKHFQRIRGLPAEAIVGRPVVEVIGEEELAQFVTPYLERLRRGEMCSYERTVGPAGAVARWHLVRLVPIMAGDGAFGGYYVVATDVHETKLAQEQLRESEAQLRLYTDNIPDAVAYLDSNRVIRFVNKHFAEQRGVSADEIVGKTTAEALGAETAAWIAERTQRVFDRGEVATYERTFTMHGRGEVAPREGGAALRRVGAARARHVRGRARHQRSPARCTRSSRRARRSCASSPRTSRVDLLHRPRARLHLREQPVPRHARHHARVRARQAPRRGVLAKVMDELAPHLERVLLGEERIYERTIRVPTARTVGSASGCRQGATPLAWSVATTSSPPTSTTSSARRRSSRRRNGSCAR